MAAWLVSVLFCALAGSTVLADDRLTFPELAPVAPGTVGNRIVSGWESELGQFPHQLSLRMVSPAGAVSACGGTIISAEWGLTAAHCTAGRVTVVIRAGTVNLTLPTYIFDTTKYYNHPLYNEAMQSVVQPHDIGLLEFGRSLVLNEFVKPIRLQRSSAKDYNYEGELLIASGWGRTWTDGASPENMNWVYQYGVSNQQCLSAFGGSSIIVDSTICSRYFNVTSQSTCQGDSGGCLAHRDEDGELSQVGVTSFVSAMGCHVGMPAGFIRPGHYHAWFTEVSGQNFDWELEEPEVPTTAVPEGGDSSASSEEEDEPSPSSEEDSESSPSSEEDSESSPSSEEDSEPSPSSEEDSEPSPSSEEDNESSASSGGNDEE